MIVLDGLRIGAARRALLGGTAGLITRRGRTVMVVLLPAGETSNGMKGSLIDAGRSTG